MSINFIHLLNVTTGLLMNSVGEAVVVSLNLRVLGRMGKRRMQEEQHTELCTIRHTPYRTSTCPQTSTNFQPQPYNHFKPTDHEGL